MPDRTYTHMGFQKMLNDLNMPKEHAMVYTALHEHLLQCSEEIDRMAGIVGQLAENVSGFVGLHEATQKKVQDFLRRHDTPGVSIKSEPNV